MNEEIIYFEINNWFCGRDYPNDEIFDKWVNEMQFSDDEWCKANRLCVVTGPIDMSINWCVAAPRSWVEENCPKLLSDEEFKYKIATVSKEGRTITEHSKKYSDFRCYPDSDGDVYGNIDGWQFKEYCEDNFGVSYNDSWWDDDEEDEEDDKDE